MKPITAVVSVLTLAVLPCTPRAQDSLADLVPATAKFVCYIDLQGVLDFVGHDVVRDAVARAANDQGGINLRSDWNARLAKEWGIDPLRDIQGLMLFGDDIHGREPNAVLLTSDRIDVTLEKLRDMGALVTQERDGVAVDRLAPDQLLSAFGVEDAQVDAELFLSVHRPRGKTSDRRAIVLGTSARQMAPALDALRGAKASSRAGALTLATRKGCIVYVEVADVLRELMEKSPASRMANKATHLSIQVNLDGGELAIAAAVQTETVKDARQIAALINGLKALVSLVEPDEDVPAQALEMLDRARAEVDGNRVTLEIGLPKSLIDQARRAVHQELGGRAADEARDEPRAGTKTRRHIR